MVALPLSVCSVCTVCHDHNVLSVIAKVYIHLPHCELPSL